MKIYKVGLTLFSMVIPISIIYFSMDSYVNNSVDTLIIKLQEISVNKITGESSSINWKNIIGYGIVFLFIYHYIIKRKIKRFKERLSAMEKRQSVILLLLDMTKTIIIWASFFGFASWLEITDNSYFNSVNFILFSIMLGELFRIKILFKEKMLKYKKED